MARLFPAFISAWPANCEGAGVVSVESRFLPSIYTPCPVCQGQRYNDKMLEITYRDKNIAEVLDLTIESSHQFFVGETPVLRALDALLQVGLGYLRLGPPATERSGGEPQRITLATELQRTQHGPTLYVFDEPTTGLHPADVALLMSQLGGLVYAGNTVVAVEHNMQVATASDRIIDIGPGAGNEGGLVVAQGTPAKVAESRVSRTAPFLARERRGHVKAGFEGSGPSVALREGPNGGLETPQVCEEGGDTPWRWLLDRRTDCRRHCLPRAITARSRKVGGGRHGMRCHSDALLNATKTTDSERSRSCSRIVLSSLAKSASRPKVISSKFNRNERSSQAGIRQ